MTTDEWVSVARPTVMSGLCIDWYPSARAFENGNAYTVSASRDGVLVDGHSFLHTIPAYVLSAANHAYLLLKTRRDSDRDAARDLATHEEVRHGAGWRHEIRRRGTEVGA